MIGLVVRAAGVVGSAVLRRAVPATDVQVAAAERTVAAQLAMNVLAAQEMFPQYLSATHAQETAGVAPRHPVAGALAPATGPQT